ncbi:delta-like protein C [Haliotis rubra]|uniref:delta-like protein C n=1 Tax=Haliotis rubra TaxID=36100 RepID=UPI001EE58F40|nr:delta-like protein C [Haliotis rubra]
MDTLSKLINIRAAVTEQTAMYNSYTLSRRTTLKIAVRAYCDPDWYGSACEKYCKATTDHSHYTCHPHTGAKMCFEGWKGDSCNKDIDECTETDQMCQHGGTCTNTNRRFECACAEGIKDTFNITLLGEIDHTNRGDLAVGLNRLITELGGIPGKVDVKFKNKTQKESK